MNKKVAIGYSYLNAEKEIPRSLKPWVSHVDHIIAIDGRYWTPQSPEMLKKNYSEFSTDNSHSVLKDICGDKLIWEQFYGNQMEKRQRYLDIAGNELDCDFLIVLDTDEMIYDNPNWDRFDKQLTGVYEGWPDQHLFGMEVWIPDFKSWQPQFNEVPPNSWIPYTRIHRNPADMYYCLNHYTFALKSVTREQIYKYLFENPAVNPVEPDSNKYLLKSKIVLDAVKIRTNRILRPEHSLTFGNEWTWQNMHWENFHYLVEAYTHHHGGKFVYEELKEQYPNIQYYFDEGGRLVPFHEQDGEYIIHKPVSEILPVKPLTPKTTMYYLRWIYFWFYERLLPKKYSSRFNLPNTITK